MADLFNSTCNHKDYPELPQAATTGPFNITEPVLEKLKLLDLPKTLSSSFEGVNLEVLSPNNKPSGLPLTLLLIGLCLLPLAWKVLSQCHWPAFLGVFAVRS